MNATSTPENDRAATPTDASGSPAQPASPNDTSQHAPWCLQLTDDQFGCDGRICQPGDENEAFGFVTLATGRHVAFLDDGATQWLYPQIEVFAQRRLDTDDRAGLTDADTHLIVLGTNPEGIGDDRYSYLTLTQAHDVILAINGAIQAVLRDKQTLDDDKATETQPGAVA